jgi:glycerol-3-phosphate dehydrogenase
VDGVLARDRTTGERLEIRSRLVANVSGPWAFRLTELLKGRPVNREMKYSKGCHIVTPALTNGHALALGTRLEHESLISRGGRHIFLMPWRGHTLIGTTNVPFSGSPDHVQVTGKDIDDFLDEINRAAPTVALARDRVLYAFSGLYPLVNREVRDRVYQGSGKYLIYDHAQTDGLEGLITAIGAKFTTARKLAERCVDLAFRKLGKASPPCETPQTPIDGGDIQRVEEYVAAEIRQAPKGLEADTMRDLVYSHGTRYPEVLSPLSQEPSLAERVSRFRATTRASIRYAAREEMALNLADVVFRRTGLGTLGHPGPECLETCASILAEEHGWGAERARKEVGEVEEAFRRFL